MADVNANIGVNIDTSNALAQIKALQRQLSEFYTSISRSSETAALAQRDLQKNLVNSINSLGGFSAELRTIKTSAESFTTALEKNKFSMREYFRYAGASTRTFGRLFKSEFDTINKVAEDNVKRLQTQYIKLGRDSTGAMKAIAVMPTELNMSDLATKTQIAAQRQALFNQLVKQGSTNLLNFGKNTQWAGRQLMVGFTIPLSILGNTASKAFMDMETAAIKFKKVYGDLGTSREEANAQLQSIQDLAKGFTQYGIAASQTVQLAADAAAAGFKGVDLQRQTTEATRLSVLGQIDQQKALETTIALQNAFQMSSEDLAGSIDFLNAVENQTVTSLDDITTAIPKAAPVVQQLGGNVKDLAFFLTAMKEGGINASEGANALKSGLASIINPTKKASEMLASMGINIKSIVESNRGNLKATVIDFANALNQLAPLERARAIEQMFGKFQFARLSTLFQNVTRDGTQAARVLQLAGSSVEDLANLSQQELGITADSPMMKFKKSVEDLKISLIPLGKTFLEAATPIVKFIGDILDKFNNLGDGTKKAITVLTIAIGAIGPIALMAFGLLANALANGIKFIQILRNGYLNLTGQSKVLSEQTNYLTIEQQNAAAVAHSLDQSHAKLIQTFNIEKQALQQLASAYSRAASAASSLLLANPGIVLPGRTPKKYADGVSIVPGTGNTDSVPAMLTPGESVIPKAMTKKYGSLIQGMINDNIPGFIKGVVSVGDKDLSLDVASSRSIGPMNAMIKQVLSKINQVDGLEQVLVEALSRIATQTENTVEKLVAQLQHAARNMGNIHLGEDIIGRQGYSAPSSVGSVKQQIQTERGSAGLEEYNRAKRIAEEQLRTFMKEKGTLEEDITKVIQTMNDVNNQVVDLTTEQKQYVESFGLSASKIAQLLQVDRAHVTEFLNEEKKYVEAWHSSVWVAQPHLENEMSNSIKKSKDAGTELYKQYITKLNEEKIDNDQKLELIRKINNNAALTEDELEIQKRVLQAILDDITAMAKLTPNFGTQARALIAGQNFKATLPTPSTGVGVRDAGLIANQRQKVVQAINLGSNEFSPQAEGIRTIDEFMIAAEKRAETQSPSRRTFRLGKNIIAGLVNALKSGVPEVKTVAQVVADQSMPLPTGKLNTRRAFREQGAPPSIGSDQENNTKKIKESTMSLSKLNNIVMSSTFALTSFAGIGSMAGGALGDLSSAIFKYSGLLFALMNVTQLLTQVQIAKLAADRIGLARGAMISAKQAGSSIAGMAGKTGILGSIGRGVLGSRVALGLTNPYTAGFVVAIGASIGIIKLSNAAREKERQAIYGVTDAMKTTAKQAQVLGDFFGVTAKQSAFERNAALKNREIVAPQTRSQRDELRQNSGFQKEFKTTISNLRKATNQEAKLAFSSLALDLSSRGYAKDQVQTIIDALREEAGKTDVKFDVKSLDFSEKSLTDFGTNIDGAIKKVQDKFKNGFKNVQQYVVTGGNERNTTYKLVNKLVPGKELEKALSEVSGYIASTAKSAATMFQDGLIDSKQYSQYLGTITGRISQLDAAQRQLVLIKIFKEMGVDAGPFMTALKDTKTQMKAIALISAGILDKDSPIIHALGSKDAKTVSRGVNALNKEWNKYFSSVDKATEGSKNLGNAIQTLSEKITNAKKTLQDMITELKNQITAYGKLRSAGLDVKTAMELAGNATIAAALASGQVKKGTTAWKELIAKAKEYAGLLNQIRALQALQGIEQQTNDANAKIKAYNTLIKKGMDYKDALEYVSDAENVALINNPKLAKTSLQGVIDKLEALKAASDKAANLDPMAGINKSVDKFNETYRIAMDDLNNQEKAIRFQYAGQISDAEKAVADAQAEVDRINGIIDEIQTNITLKKRDMEINIDRPIEALRASISQVQQDMENAIDKPIAELQKQIDALQHTLEIGIDKQLSDISNRNNILSNNLAIIEHQEKAINEQYDAQIQALEEVNKLNQEGIQQGKTKMSIADALSRGDISAAAQAAQELRQQQAAAQATTQKDAMEAARQQALGQVSANGMTRIQIEQEQWVLSQQAFKLEQDKLVIQQQIWDKQQQIYALEQQRQPYLDKIAGMEKQIADLELKRLDYLKDIQDWEDQIWHLTNDTTNSLFAANKELRDKQKNLNDIQKQLDAALKAVNDQRDQWEKAKLNVDILKTTIEKELNPTLKTSYDTADATKKAVADVTDAAKEATKSLDSTLNPSLQAAAGAAQSALNAVLSLNTTVVTTHIINTIYTSSGSPSTGTTGGTDGTGGTSTLEPTPTAPSSYMNSGAPYKYGGRVYKMASGGITPGIGLLDKVPALLTPGEFVMNKTASQAFGPLLSSLNQLQYPDMLSSGSVNNKINSSPRTNVMNNRRNNSYVSNSSDVYNYSVNVEVVGGQAADPEAIASTVLNKIKQINDQQVRRRIK